VRVPDFTPTRVLDFGSGVGSAFWAIEAVWPRVVNQAVAVEASSSMQELANALRAQVCSTPSGYRPLKAFEDRALFRLSRRIGKAPRAVCEAIQAPMHHVEAPA
jgi:ribosomal protein RSM22 (predicted rRNA methylase)